MISACRSCLRPLPISCSGIQASFCFSTAARSLAGYQIDNVVNAAAALHQSWRILECVCPEEVARQRLEDHATAGSHPAGNRNFQLYLEVKSRFEAISLPKTVIDTSEPLLECIEQALAAFH